VPGAHDEHPDTFTVRGMWRGFRNALIAKRKTETTPIDTARLNASTMPAYFQDVR
jgi:hypothetical protein